MRLLPQQEQTLHAAVDRIIPADEFSSAWEAGVGDYLARQFEADLSSRVDEYVSGLNSLEAESLALFRQGFALLSDDQRDTVLKHVEANEVFTPWTVAPATFFNLLVNTTAEGFYSEPEQGGNRSKVSWAMTGFEEPMSQADEQDLR
jgi:hypothetical protein